MTSRVASLGTESAHRPRSLRPAIGGLTLCFALTGACSDSGDDTGGKAGSSNGDSGGSTNTGGTMNAGGAATSGTSGSDTGGTGGASGGSGGSGGQAGTSGAAGEGGTAADGGGAGSARMDGGGGAMKSGGCGTTHMLKNGSNSVMSGGQNRTYSLRIPDNYDNSQPYRLILGFHGAYGKSSDVAPSYFGLWDLSKGSTIFAAPDAVGGIWKGDTDTTMVSDLLTALKADLCIDTSRIEIEGFSQGGAMVWTLACALPGTFRVAVVHSGGGLPMPKTCQPIPFISSLGHDGSGQGMSSDFFAMTNGCTVETLEPAKTGGHACSDYKGCSAGHPTRWCAYDGGHTPSPTDSGMNMSWMPQEVWTFVSQF